MLTNVSVAFIYREASFKSETISQTYMAENLVLLEQQGNWNRVRLDDNYEGWVATNFVVDKPDSWDDHNFVYSANHIAQIHENPDPYSPTIRDVTILSGLPCLKRQDGWVQVLLPDGQVGWMVDNTRSLVQSIDVEQLVQTAFEFQGIQYFWAGRTPKGFDCSGFVQAVFNLNGIQLPRDSHQQAEVGTLVDGDFKSWHVGDLIFFSEYSNNISHVAISLGEGDFIHASGFVKMNSVNPENSDLYASHYAEIFTKTKRII